MRAAILLSGRAYLPEAYAYSDYLAERGWAAQCVSRPESCAGADVAISFSGGHHMARLEGVRAVVHEYHSLSTGSVPRARNLAKRWLSKRPSGRIFLNEMVRDGMGFRDGLPELLRPLGIDAALFGCANPAKADHDIVYCGSIGGRPGLLATVERLARIGLSVILFGHPPPDAERAALAGLPITFAGAIDRAAVPAALARGRIGLNYTPDIYPLNVQTSTKTLEYTAAGLPILANRYGWIERFAERRGITPIWLEDLHDTSLLANPAPPTARLDDLIWETLLDRVGFEPFLRRLVEG